jgi:hypothetical protein
MKSSTIGPDAEKLFKRLTEIYLMQSSKMVWCTEKVWTWFFCSAMRVTEEINESTDNLQAVSNLLVLICTNLFICMLYDCNNKKYFTLSVNQAIKHAEDNLKRLSKHPFTSRYIHADPEDFREEIARLPPDANPIDPRFRDIDQFLRGQELVQGGGRNAELHALNRELQNLPRHHEDVNINRLLAQIHDLRDIGQLQEAAMMYNQYLLQLQRYFNQPTVVRGNLDPRLPLMQLFLASFFPWNSLDTTGLSGV